MSLWVKICGVTSVEDARLAVEAGADAVGVNLVDGSKRKVDLMTARAVREAVGNRTEVVGVVADHELAELEELRARTGIRWLQLHGTESPELVRSLLPEAYKAVRIGAAQDAAEAGRFPGARLLTDAKVPGELGGTGHTFDWSLVVPLARTRSLVLAGGLTPENVASAVRSVRPFGVDTASGVEGPDPRRKDPGKIERFVKAARAALVTLAALASFGCGAPVERTLVLAPGAPTNGRVMATFEVERCNDAMGGPVTPRPTSFTLIAEGPPESGAAGELRLVATRRGYGSLLARHPAFETGKVVFRALVEPPSGRPLLGEVRLPYGGEGPGELTLADDWTAVPTPDGGSRPAPANVVLYCVLAPSTRAGLDSPLAVDYEPEREARAHPSRTKTTP